MPHRPTTAPRHPAQVLARCPELTAADHLVRAFAEVLTTRTGQHLKDWIVTASAEDLPASTPSPPAWRRTGTPSSRA
ncbi:hypothetical protein FMEAI12_7340003 [Parafrankia sp. Ea1.12]|nr:hypothetical protein FMEAI12_7340003 [Parafrankia sp. Ea1.12]